jgi:replicative DNA helicase
LAQAIEKIDELYLTKGALTGLSTGFQDLDDITNGLQPSDLVIIAGRPSMGKTAFMMNIAESAVISGGKPVLVFSLEMPSHSLIMRMLSSLGRIDQGKIRTGQLGDDDWPRLTSAVTLLNDKPLFIDDTPGLTPTEMRARSRRIVREHGPLGLIVVDYLQLMQVSGMSENRAVEISEISRSLKSIAKEFDCPVIAGSQLNRSLEQRTDKRPVMSDLRESGAIEQDADVIMAVYRDEVYHEDTPDKGIAEIIILKQRNGPIGRKKLAFVGRFTKFEDLARDYEDFYE